MAKSKTSFKKGNKAAEGNPNSGRPKEYDPAIEAEALRAWAQLPTSLTLRAFAPHRGYSSQSLYKWEESSPVFLEAMDFARDLIGTRREEMLILQGNARPFERYATWYDKSLHAHDRGDKQFDIEAKMKLEAQSKVTHTPEEAQSNKAFMDQIERLQQSLDRSIADKSKSTDNKS